MYGDPAHKKTFKMDRLHFATNHGAARRRHGNRRLCIHATKHFTSETMLRFPTWRKKITPLLSAVSSPTIPKRKRRFILRIYRTATQLSRFLPYSSALVINRSRVAPTPFERYLPHSGGSHKQLNGRREIADVCWNCFHTKLVGGLDQYHGLKS
jgi:hypothetical protein